jgi:hypothetical protein
MVSLQKANGMKLFQPGVDSSAMTLSDYAVMSNSPLVMAITMSLIQNGSILADIPFITRPTMLVNGVRWQDNLPSPSWQKANTDPTVTTGKPTAYQEQAYIVRNAIDTDLVYLQDINRIGDTRASRLNAYLRGLSYDYNDKFINNDHLSGEDDCFVGMRYRLDNYATYGLVSEMKIDAGGVDMTQSGMTSASANTMVETMQQVLDYMGLPDGDGVVFYCNDTLRRRLDRAVRVLGAGAGWNTVVDAFGRSITKFKNARIVDIGRKADQSTRIILNTETSAGAAGASTYTSMYAVSYGEDRLVGWQFAPLGESIQDIGMIGNGGAINRIMINWVNGILPQHTRCISRIYDIKIS